MISLKIYRYILIILILLCILGLILIFRNKKSKLTIKIGSAWFLFLLLLNFSNMYYTLKYYDDNKDNKGPKGPKGNKGVVGKKGADYICSDPTCKSDKDPTGVVYGTNMKKVDGRYEPVLNDPEIKIGKCIFPFIHNGSLEYGPITDARKDGMDKDTDNPWCATSLKSDRTYKTYGYTNYSELEAEQRKLNRERSEARSDYIKNNTGILDIKLVAGNRSTEPCPSGFKRIEKDLNEGAGGKYLFLCTKTGLGSSGISDLTVMSPAGDKTYCDTSKGYKKINYDLNKDTDGGKELNLCFKKSSSNFIKDIRIENAQLDLGIEGYNIVNTTEEGSNPVNLNDGTTGREIYLFTNNKPLEYNSIDAAFVFKQDKNLYFFKNESYYQYDNKKEEVGDPKSIKEDWGIDLEGSTLDAVFTYGFNDKIYFFQGSLCYEYDEKRQEIAPGFPKYITDHWQGIPDNINAVFTYNKDGVTYFFKGNKVYKYDDRNNKIARGYPQIISNKFPGLNIQAVDAVFSHSDGSTYFISGQNYYVLGQNSEVLSDYPRLIRDKFPIPNI